MNSEASLRAILSKSPPKRKAESVSSESGSYSHETTLAPSSLSDPSPIARPKPTLQYATIDTHAGVPKPTIATSNTTTPLRRASYFASFAGCSAFDTDDDTFDSTRRYTTSTHRHDELTSRPDTLNKSLLDSMISEPKIKQPELARIKSEGSLEQFGKDVFRSFRGRSAFDADDDEFDHGRAYTLDTDKTEEKNVTPLVLRPITPVLSPSQAKLPRANSPIPLGEGQDNLNHANTEQITSHTSETKVPGPKDEEVYENSQSWKFRGSPPPSTKTTPEKSSTTPRSILKNWHRKVSWADEVPNRPLFEQITQQTPRKSSDGAEGRKETPKTPVGAAFTIDPNQPTPAAPTSAPNSQVKKQQPLAGYQTIHKAQGKTILHAMKDSPPTSQETTPISPKKTPTSNMWDPEDDAEWDMLEAYKINQTFRQTYRQPHPLSPAKSEAQGYFDTAMQTLKANFGLLTIKKDDNDGQMINEQLMQLENTFYHDPNGDVNDEIMETFWLNDRTGIFGLTTSPRAMHIIDLSAYFTSDDVLVRQARPRLCDAVATILAHTNQACLDAFLDPKVTEFVYKREIRRSKSSSILVIRRIENEVICGVYSHLGFSLQWNMYVKSLISATGLWYEVYAAQQPGSMPVVDGVPDWSVLPAQEKMEVMKEDVVGSPRKLQLSPTKNSKVHSADEMAEWNSKLWLYQNRVLAKYMLRDVWRYFSSLWDCRASWDADGEVSEVRLVRELILSEE